jgi:hypothetical protein
MSQTSDENYVLLTHSKNQTCGIFCQVCSFLIKTSDDAKTFNEWKTCHDCYLRFIESRKDEWSAGWRPKNNIIESLYSEKSRIFIK